MVQTAINIPAQTFYYTRLALLNILGGIPMIIFYCSSSNGRGPRCAGWMQDALHEAGNKNAEPVVLAGGIKNWVKEYPDLSVPVLHFPA